MTCKCQASRATLQNPGGADMQRDWDLRAEALFLSPDKFLRVSGSPSCLCLIRVREHFLLRVCAANAELNQHFTPGPRCLPVTIIPLASQGCHLRAWGRHLPYMSTAVLIASTSQGALTASSQAQPSVVQSGKSLEAEGGLQDPSLGRLFGWESSSFL